MYFGFAARHAYARVGIGMDTHSHRARRAAGERTVMATALTLCWANRDAHCATVISSMYILWLLAGADIADGSESWT